MERNASCLSLDNKKQSLTQNGMLACFLYEAYDLDNYRNIL